MRKPSTRLSCALALLLAAACGGGGDKPAPPPTAAVVETGDKAPTPAPEPVAQTPKQPAPSDIAEADVRALLDHWLAAQNSGDFAAYSQLYAERFAGIKRVGTRTERYDLPRWLRDRKRMFGKPMKLEASEVAIKTSVGNASVRFVQSYSSGSFSDRGPKELRVLPTKAGLQITSEEMLASEVGAAASAHAAALDASDLRLVVHTKHTYVMLDDDGSIDQGLGEPELDDVLTKRVIPARMRARDDRLPAAVKAAFGSSVQLFGADGPVCSAKLGAVYLLRRVVPHFGTLQHWNGIEQDDDVKHAPLPLPTVTAAVWDEASEQTLLVASLSDVKGNCDDALWARAADKPAPLVFAPKALPDALRARVEQSVHGLPAYQKLEREYLKQTSGMEPDERGKSWDYYDDEQPSFRLWENQGRQLVSYEATVGSCGDIGGALWALYEVKGDELQLLNKPGDETNVYWMSIGTIIDANGDGLLDVLGGDEMSNAPGETNAVLRGTSNGPRLVRETYPPFHDCGC